MRYFSMLILLLFFNFFPAHSQTIQVMIVTGGHDYDSLEFFQMFDKMDDLEYEHFIQPEANREIAKNQAKDFDVIVFYDMWQNITPEEESAYLKMIEEGKPLLFLHHSLVSYQKWPEFEKIIGGKYVEKARGIPDEDVSSFEHDVWEYCSVENYTPVTVGLRNLRFFDEIYINVRITDDVFPLLRISHPKSMKYLAWENRYNNSRILYIQPGHDKRTFQEPDYQKLLHQSILYLSQNLN